MLKSFSQAISERLAENSHDVWAIGKLKQLESTGGTHPDLIPYDLMTDQQKEYDRKASTDTLKFLTLCGYSFVKKQVRRTRQSDTRIASFLLKFLCESVHVSEGHLSSYKNRWFASSFFTAQGIVQQCPNLTKAELDFLFSVSFPIFSKFVQ